MSMSENSQSFISTANIQQNIKKVKRSSANLHIYSTEVSNNLVQKATQVQAQGSSYSTQDSELPQASKLVQQTQSPRSSISSESNHLQLFPTSSDNESMVSPTLSRRAYKQEHTSVFNPNLFSSLPDYTNKRDNNYFNNLRLPDAYSQYQEVKSLSKIAQKLYNAHNYAGCISHIGICIRVIEPLYKFVFGKEYQQEIEKGIYSKLRKQSVKLTIQKSFSEGVPQPEVKYRKHSEDIYSEIKGLQKVKQNDVVRTINKLFLLMANAHYQVKDFSTALQFLDKILLNDCENYLVMKTKYMCEMKLKMNDQAYETVYNMFKFCQKNNQASGSMEDVFLQMSFKKQELEKNDRKGLFSMLLKLSPALIGMVIIRKLMAPTKQQKAIFAMITIYIVKIVKNFLNNNQKTIKNQKPQ